jgi:8-oxo-dGTP pyrophosphatase MutT (NUDIX family)
MWRPRRTSPRHATMAGMDGRFVRRTRRVAYDNAWITVWHDEVSRPDGSPGIYGVVHFQNLAAGVVALDDQDRVALVGQHRYTMDAYSWEIPEGGVPDGESAQEGARRELREETGVEASTWRELARVDLSNSISDERAVLFLATGLTHGEAEADPTEALELRWVPFDEALAMTLDGRITDAMSVVAIQRVALLGLAGVPAPDDRRSEN